MSCVYKALDKVPACEDEGDPGSIQGGGKLNVSPLLKDRDDPGQVSLYNYFILNMEIVW
jgi:hypothetical protein